jgi:hypothetical protein
MADVLNTSLFLPFGSRNTSRAAAEIALVQDLLCYDTVYLLTDHMAAAGMLAGMMGADAFEEALERGAFRFLHDRQILAWPTRPGYSGPTPIMPIATMAGGEHGDGGVSHYPTARLAGSAIVRFGWGEERTRRLGDLTAANTLDFQWPIKAAMPGAPPLAESVLSDVRALKNIVLEVPELALKLSDLNTLDKNLRNPRKTPLNTTNLAFISNKIESGWSILEAKAPISPKQLSMLHLAIADRFLLAQEMIPDAVLHTEPIVESILTARAKRIRKATAEQVDILLSASSVNLPVLTASGAVPYIELLKSRDTSAGRAFRAMVARRDAEGVRSLLAEYVASLHKPIAERLGVKAARWLTGSLVGEIVGKLPGGSLVVNAVDTFLVDRLLAGHTPAFYVDTTLRRIADGASTAEIKVRP